MCDDKPKCGELERILAILGDLINPELDIDPISFSDRNCFVVDIDKLPGGSTSYQDKANKKEKQIEELSNLIQQLIVLDENGQIDYLLINEMQLKFYNIHQLLQQIYDAKLEVDPHQSKQLNIYLYEMLSRILC